MDGVADATWRKSSKSGNSGNCVEAGLTETGRVLVRDTVDRSGVILMLAPAGWREFTDRLK
jgi:Domain of unknown function (DUF397)